MRSDLTLDQARTRLFAITSLLIGALVVGAIVIGIKVLDNQAQIEGFEKTTTLICERAREFGAPLARFYREQHVFSPAMQAEYEATIPKRC